MNILFIHEISYLRDPIFEFHVLPELLFLRGHNVYAVDYGREQGSGLISGYQETDVARVYPDAKVHLIRPPFLKMPVIGRAIYSCIYYVVVYKVLHSHKIDVITTYPRCQEVENTRSIPVYRCPTQASSQTAGTTDQDG